MIPSNNEILEVIEIIRDSFEGSVNVYTQGSCVKFAMILKKLYPKGQILYDLGHAVFEINGLCYDINGIAEKNKNHIKIEDYGLIDSYYFMNQKYKLEVKGG